MKIALPTRDGQIDDHFGHCDHFTIVTVESGAITNREKMASPEGCGCKSDIAPTLAKQDVRLLLGGNMGEGAKNVLNANGIQVIRGCKGPIDDVVEAYIKGQLKDNQELCDHHDCDHH